MISGSSAPAVLTIPTLGERALNPSAKTVGAPSGRARRGRTLFRLMVLQGPGVHLFRRPLLFVYDLLRGEFKHGVEPVDDGHGKYHVAVLAPDKEIPEYAVGDVPDEIGDGGELACVARWFPLCLLFPSEPAHDCLGGRTSFFGYRARDSLCDIIGNSYPLQNWCGVTDVSGDPQ